MKTQKEIRDKCDSIVVLDKRDKWQKEILEWVLSNGEQEKKAETSKKQEETKKKKTQKAAKKKRK